MKLLSPAGNFESLKMALFNGADEVYLGVNDFNARNNVDSFTLDNLKDAVDLCHLYKAKINLAINILFKDEELFSALSVVTTAYNYGVDAFIIQDLALAFLIRKNLPDAVLHASTQMAIHNLEGVNALLPYGFSRVVLARETPLDEIKRIKDNSKIEIEYFVHGALCVSFSGNCYLSSYLNDASGNRGKCKQLCRLPYTLYQGQKRLKKGYLLSAKDFDLSNKLAQLKNAGVDVLKIEGRARRPFYVATATNQYRKALDGKPVDRKKLDLAFNRQSTCGYFDGNGQIISNVSSHTGIFIGKVTNVIEKKTYNEVYFTSNQPLYKKSTFKTFFNGEEKTIISAFDLKEILKNQYLLTTTASVKKGEDVHLIIDALEEENTLKFIKKIDYPITISLEPNKPITAEFLSNDGKTIVLGDLLEEAKSSPITTNELELNFRKSEYFNIILSTNINGNCFLAKSALNDFRRNVLSKLFDSLTSPFYKNAKQVSESEFNEQISRLKQTSIATPLTDFDIVERIEQIKNSSAKTIIYSPSEYKISDIKTAKEECQNLNKEFYLDLPNFVQKEDIVQLKGIIEQLKIGFVANNYYALTLNSKFIVGANLNVYNNLSASLLNAPYLTAEKDGENNVRLPYMTLRHCPYKNHLNADCKNCPHDDSFYYQMPNGKQLRIKRKKLSTCTFYLTD